ncbi:unnamed protein product [Rotaria socialis]
MRIVFTLKLILRTFDTVRSIFREFLFRNISRNDFEKCTLRKIILANDSSLLVIVSSYSIATLSYEQALGENNTNLTTHSALTTAVTTLITSNATSYITITTVPITTQNATSRQTTATITDLTTTVTSAVTHITTPSTSNSTVTTTTTTLITTTKATGRKFDGFSFIGGIILALGLCGIFYLIVSYLRRSNRLPYANLQ